MMSKTRFAIGALALSASGLIGILGYEGYSDTAYIPVPGDVPTIGFGSTEGVKLGDTITPEKAIERAYRDIEDVERCIKSAVKVPINSKMYDSLVSFVYNIGCKNFKGSTLLKKLNQNDLSGACLEMKRWVYSGEKKIKGLETRRESEYALCMEGVDDARR